MTVLKAFSSLAVAGVFCSFLSCYGMQMPGQPPDDRRSGGDSASMSSLDVFLDAGKRAAEGLSLQRRNGSASTAEDRGMMDGYHYSFKRVVREFREYKDVVAGNADIIFSFLEGRGVKLASLIGNFKKLGVRRSLIAKYEPTDAADVEESSQKEESSQQGSDELASSVADDTSEQPVAKKNKLSKGREGKKPKK